MGIALVGVCFLPVKSFECRGAEAIDCVCRPFEISEYM
jgi:hypothetical protein